MKQKFLRIEPGWVLILCCLYYFNPAGIFWPFMAAVACHEAGHIIALWSMGVPIQQLRLELAGAALVTGPMDYSREILCAMAGPLASLLMIFLRHQYPKFSMVSLVLAGFNLLPVFPLDGGRMLRAALLLRLEMRTAQAIMDILATILATALLSCAIWLSVGLGGGLWPILTAAAIVLRLGLCRRQGEA